MAICLFLFSGIQQAFGEEFIYYWPTQLNGSGNVFLKNTETLDDWEMIFWWTGGTNLWTDWMKFSEDLTYMIFANSADEYKLYRVNTNESLILIGSPFKITDISARYFDLNNGKIIYSATDWIHLKTNTNELWSGEIVISAGSISPRFSPDWNKFVYRHSSWEMRVNTILSDNSVVEWNYITTSLEVNSTPFNSWKSTNDDGTFCYAAADNTLKCSVNFWQDYWDGQIKSPGVVSNFSFLRNNINDFVFSNWEDNYTLYKWSLTGSVFTKIWNTNYIQGIVFGNEEQNLPNVEEFINNWLSCTNSITPDLSSVVWQNDFMNNSWFMVNVDDDWWTRSFSWSGTIDDLPYAPYVNRAAVQHSDQTSWGNFSSWSLNYPWTSRTNIRWGNKSPLLLSFSDSEIKPNVIQFFGVNDIGFGYAGTFNIQKDNLDQTWEFSWTVSSSGVVTVWIKDYSLIRKLLWNYSSGFNGMRYWVAPRISKTSCDFQYNICEWQAIWDEYQCNPWKLAGWIPAWECQITWSGSEYWSGSCIPTMTASWSVIPPILVPGKTLYDSEWNAVWNIYTDGNNLVEFSCGFLDSDSWFETISKWIKCGFNFISDSITAGKSGADAITGSSREIADKINIKVWSETGSVSTGALNPILESLSGIDEKIVKQRYVKLSYGLFIFFFVALFFGLIIAKIKGSADNLTK